MNQVFIFPTDTVFGIGTPMFDTKGIKRIYDIKGRDFNKLMAILCKDLESLSSYAEINKKARILASKFLPGALTLILKSTPKYEKMTGEKTVGIRIPNHPVALKLIETYGPLKTTSVNQSGEAPLNDYETINQVYGHLVNQVFESDIDIDQVSSTVVDLTQAEIKIIRSGHITKEMIEESLKQ